MKASFIQIAFLLLLNLAHNSVNAWEPCLPFCDARCSGRAALQMGTETSTSIGSISKSCSQLSKALAETNKSIVDMSTSIAETHLQQKAEFLSGLDAAINKYTLTNDIKGEVIASFANNVTTTIHQNIKGAVKTSNIVQNDAMFGENAQVYFAPYQSDDQGVILSNIFANQQNTILENVSIAIDARKHAGLTQMGTKSALSKINDLSKIQLSQREKAKLNGTIASNETPINLFKLKVLFKERATALLNGISEEQVEIADLDKIRTTNFITQQKSVTLHSLLHGTSMQSQLSEQNAQHTLITNTHGLNLKLNRQSQEKNSMLHQLVIQAQSRNAQLALTIATHIRQ